MPSVAFSLAPPLCELDWPHQYRIVSSAFPAIAFFETLVDPEDRISGPGATPVMAAFTQVGAESRFSDGSFGIYSAARTLDTAIEQTKFHRARFLAFTQEAPGEIDLRVDVGEIAKPLHDIRGDNDGALHAPETWAASQAFGAELRAVRSWGLVYRSVRHPGGECIAALRPPAVTIPRQGPHLSYLWNGTRIVRVYEKILR